MKHLITMMLALIVSVAIAQENPTINRMVEQIGKTNITNYQSLVPDGYKKNHHVKAKNQVEYIYYRNGQEFIKYEFIDSQLMVIYISDDKLMSQYYNYNFERGIYDARTAYIHHNETLDDFKWAIYNKSFPH